VEPSTDRHQLPHLLAHPIAIRKPRRSRPRHPPPHRHHRPHARARPPHPGGAALPLPEVRRHQRLHRKLTHRHGRHAGLSRNKMYDTFFKLRGKPFQLNPDPAFFYGSRGHRRAMAYLEYGLHQSEGFIVITGEIGAGKTTIVRSLLEQLDPERVVAANIVSTQIDAHDMLRMVAAAFGVPSRNLDKAGLLLAIETYLVSITAAGKRALLIVDEAQNLSAAAVEELRMLSNFQLEDHALLQSFL